MAGGAASFELGAAKLDRLGGARAAVAPAPPRAGAAGAAGADVVGGGRRPGGRVAVGGAATGARSRDRRRYARVDAFRSRAGDRRTAGARDRPLGAGDQVFAPLTASVRLGDTAGTELTLEPGGMLTVVESTATRRFALRRGAVEARVRKLVAGERFIIETADAEIEVHGTEFRVAIGEPESVPCTGAGPKATVATRVSVTGGVVSVKWSGDEQRLHPGDEWPPRCADVASDARADVGARGSQRRRSRRSAPPAEASPPSATVHGSASGGAAGSRPAAPASAESRRRSRCATAGRARVGARGAERSLHLGGARAPRRREREGARAVRAIHARLSGRVAVRERAGAQDAPAGSDVGSAAARARARASTSRVFPTASRVTKRGRSSATATATMTRGREVRVAPPRSRAGSRSRLLACHGNLDFGAGGGMRRRRRRAAGQRRCGRRRASRDLLQATVTVACRSCTAT